MNGMRLRFRSVELRLQAANADLLFARVLSAGRVGLGETYQRHL